MRKKRRLRAKQKFWIFISILLALIIAILIFFNTYVNPIIIVTSEATVQSLTSRAVNSAVQSVLNNSNVYDDLIEVTTNDEGKITLIQAKTVLINKLSKDISRAASQNLDLISSEGVKIPIGTLSGMSVFVGLGPEITFRITSISTVKSAFQSEFTSAGINQTNHRIYLNVTTNVDVILPTATRVVTTTNHVLICEAILVGDVPDAYLNSSSLDEMLNLVPI